MKPRALLRCRDQIIARRLLPALLQDAAFVGTLNLARATEGDAMLIVLWSSADRATRPISSHGLELRHALAGIAAIAADREPRPMVWEVDAGVQE